MQGRTEKGGEGKSWGTKDPTGNAATKVVKAARSPSRNVRNSVRVERASLPFAPLTRVSAPCKGKNGFEELEKVLRQELCLS